MGVIKIKVARKLTGLIGHFHKNSQKKSYKTDFFWEVHSPLPRPKSTDDRANTAVRECDYKLIYNWRKEV